MKSQNFFWPLLLTFLPRANSGQSQNMLHPDAGIWASWPCRLPTPLMRHCSLTGAETKFMGRYLNLTSPKNLHSVPALGLGMPLTLPAPEVLSGLRTPEPLLTAQCLTSGWRVTQISTASTRRQEHTVPQNSLQRWKCSIQQLLTTYGY